LLSAADEGEFVFMSDVDSGAYVGVDFVGV
jgi:hypothetical protein